MSDENLASNGGGGDNISIIESLPDTPASMNVSEAARALQAARQRKYSAPEAAPLEAAPEPESSPQGDAAPPQEATGETQEADPVEEPSLGLPRSWTKDQTEHWSKLDRATQEFLLEHDRKSSEAVRRSQNEAAEVRKAIEAERKQVEQKRLQLEAELPALLETLSQQQLGSFSDIQTMADVERLAMDDPFRFSQWQAQQMKIAAARQKHEQLKAETAQAAQLNWQKFANEQDVLAVEKIPDLADAKKAPKLQQQAAEYLQDIGFNRNELAATWDGHEKFSLRDARLQQIILDASRYRELKAKPPVPAAKPVPQVQRPGVSQPRGASDTQHLQALSAKLTETGSIKDAQALLLARRARAQ